MSRLDITHRISRHVPDVGYCCIITIHQYTVGNGSRPILNCTGEFCATPEIAHLSAFHHLVNVLTKLAKQGSERHAAILDTIRVSIDADFEAAA